MTQDGFESGHPSVQAGVDGVATDSGNCSGNSRNYSENYDFERLERAVTFLLIEHERLSSEKSELLEELVVRGQRLTALESQLASERDRRTTAAEAVDKILGRLEHLQVSVTSRLEPV